ncbi:hypothetical protein PMIN06_007962 [Paraphaeosphaeria minitans]
MLSKSSASCFATSHRQEQTGYEVIRHSIAFDSPPHSGLKVNNKIAEPILNHHWETPHNAKKNSAGNNRSARTDNTRSEMERDKTSQPEKTLIQQTHQARPWRRIKNIIAIAIALTTPKHRNTRVAEDQSNPRANTATSA